MIAIRTIVTVVAGYISCAICLPPLIIQIQQRNLPSSMLIISILTANSIYATNALIWQPAHYDSWWDGRIFCDIQIRINVALQVAILGAASCIFRQLSLVFHPSLCLPTRAQKRRTTFIEITFCIGIPIFRMTTIYLVQPERYWIFQTSGCALAIDTSWPSCILVYLWMFILSVTGLVYAAITTIQMVRHRRDTVSVLGQGQNHRNETRVVRLYCLGLILFLTFVPLQTYGLYYAWPRHLQPYSWSRIHPPDWSERIVMLYLPQLYLRDALVRWLSIFYSISVAILVGLTPDAVDSYKSWLAQFHVWRGHLINRKSTSNLSSNGPSFQHENSNQLRITDQYGLELLSVIRQDQEAV